MVLTSCQGEFPACPSPNSTKDIEELDINLYPNPARDEVFVSNPKGLVFSSNLYDINGRLLEMSISKNTIDSFTIDLKKLYPGIYFLIFKSEKRIVIKKIVKL